MTDNVLGLLGLARRGGNLALGEEPVSAACQLGHARLVLLAADAGDTIARRGGRMAESAGAPLVKVPWSKSELGEGLGRASCALLAITDQGLAAALLEKLAGRDESLGELARAMAEKTRRRKSRQAQKKKPRTQDAPADR